MQTDITLNMWQRFPYHILNIFGIQRMSYLYFHTVLNFNQKENNNNRSKQIKKKL